MDREFQDEDGGYWTPSPKVELALACFCIGLLLFMATYAVYHLVKSAT